MLRPQKQKPRNPWDRKKSRDEIQQMQDLRRSNAASPHRNKAKYNRKAKHKGLEYV